MEHCELDPGLERLVSREIKIHDWWYENYTRRNYNDPLDEDHTEQRERIRKMGYYRQDDTDEKYRWIIHSTGWTHGAHRCVTKVEPGSFAERPGIERGMILYAANHRNAPWITIEGWRHLFSNGFTAVFSHQKPSVAAFTNWWRENRQTHTQERIDIESNNHWWWTEPP